MDAAKTIVRKLKPEKHSELFWMFSHSWAMTKRSSLHIIRSLDQLMSAVMFPIMFMLLNRYVLGGAIHTGDVSYANYLFAGVLVQTLAFGANYTTINLAVDLKEGIVDRFRSLPMAGSALLIGHVTTDLLRNIFSGVIILLVGFVVGFRPNATVFEWLQVISLSLLFTLAISWLSAILGLLVKTLEAAQWIGFVLIFPLTFISSAFVPTSTMPASLRAFAENQPVTLVINAVRSWLVGTPMDGAALKSIIWCVAIIAISMPLAAWMFGRRSPR